MDQHEDPELSALVSSQAKRHAAPAALRERIVADIAAADAPRQHEAKSQGWGQWLRIGAAFAMGVVVSVTAVHFRATATEQEHVAREAIAGHLRSLMATHLADVASSDQHTVKPWFTGKLDFSPPVYDLTNEGFALVGGRLDYLDGRPAAALVYRYRQHTINVFVWPRDERGPAPPASFSAQGFNVTGWQGQAMQFWLVSDLDASKLQAFAQTLRATVEATPRQAE